MPKLTEYPEAQSFDENDILIKDGVNGTKKIKASNAADYMGKNVIMVNEDPTPGTKVVLETTDEEYELALMSDVNSVAEEVDDVKTQTVNLQNEIYSQFEEKSITGVSIASFGDGAGNLPVKTIVISIDPIQNGSGVPSVDNVRTFSGWASSTIHVTGVNVWDEEWEVGYITPTTGTNDNNHNDRIRSKGYIPVKPNTTYYKKSPVAFWNIYYDVNKNFIGYGDAVINREFTTPENAFFVRFATEAGYGNVYNKDISFNYPSTNHEYNAYIGSAEQVVPLADFPVYGGTLDVSNHTLTVTHALIDGGSLTWNYWTESYFYAAISGKTASGPFDIRCEIYPTGASTSENAVIFNTNLLGNVYISDPSLSQDSSGAAALKAKLSGKNIWYRLATPVTYELTDDTVVSTILGNNNIWADCGDIETLIYYASDNASATIAATQAIIAPVLNNMIADVALSPNDFRIVNNQLYRITTNISAGAALIPDTNCSATTIADILKQIL